MLALFFTINPSAAYTQNLRLFRIANGTSGENPAAFWVGVEQGFFRARPQRRSRVHARRIFVSVGITPVTQMVLTSSNAVLNVAAGGLTS